MLLQFDGGRHDRLEGCGPLLGLVAGIDDATGLAPGNGQLSLQRAGLSSLVAASSSLPVPTLAQPVPLG